MMMMLPTKDDGAGAMALVPSASKGHDRSIKVSLVVMQSVVLEGEDVSASSDATMHALTVGAPKTTMYYICLSVREIWGLFREREEAWCKARVHTPEKEGGGKPREFWCHPMDQSNSCRPGARAR
jgi:hypothetical protein